MTIKYNLIINVDCDKCNNCFTEDKFEYSSVNICKTCMKNIKNKCEVCSKLGRWNFEESEYGVRCKVHKDNIMIDTMSKEYCEKRFTTKVEKLNGKVRGEYIKSNIGILCTCKNGHMCNPIPNKIQQGQGICKICAKNDPKTAKQNFITTIEVKLGGKVLGEYQGKDINVKCICKNGHICNPRPNDIRQGCGMCNHCSRSGGEIFISNVLEKLNISYDIEVNNNLIKNNFRFDFQFEYNNNKYYLEYDGNQHFKYSSLFHKSQEHFQQSQQRDIYKNYIAKKCNIKMIRIAQPQIKERSIEEFSLYLKSLIENNIDKHIIVDHELYNNWIFQEPTNETIEMYNN
jgi:hypothetical protein